MINLYRSAIIAVMVTAIVAVAGPSTGYYPKTAAFPPKTCNNDQVITWESPSWVCKSVGGGGSGGLSGVVTAVNGTLPIVATTTDAGVVTVSEAVSPDGGIDVLGSGIRIGHVIDINTMKIGGVPTIDSTGYAFQGRLVIGTGGAIYAGPSSVTITDTVLDTTPPGPVGTVINLTAEGTIDWFRLNQAVQFGCGAAYSAKASGGQVVGCDSYTLIQGGSVLFQGTDSAFTFTAGVSDTTDGITSGIARFLGLQAGPTTALWGWRFTLRSTEVTQYVARIYWAESQVAQATCTATLPDGTTASHVWNGTDGVVSYHKETITYKSPTPGNTNISCLVNTRQGSGTPIIDAAFITVGVI